MRKKTEYDGIRTYTAKERNMYLIGLAGQNVIYNIIGAGLQYYFESVIFMPAMAVGIIMSSTSTVTARVGAATIMRSTTMNTRSTITRVMTMGSTTTRTRSTETTTADTTM